MRIGLIQTSRTTKIYSVALLKIGTYLKLQGHTCKMYDKRLPKVGECEEVWLTTVFTFEIPEVLGYIKEAHKRGFKVRVGGVAASLMPQYFNPEELHIGLINDAGQCKPDYSLLGNDVDYSIAWTSRGCIRKCSFCVVPKIEGNLKNVPHWEDTLNYKANRILFFDNNWTAKGYMSKKQDVTIIKELIKEKQIKEIDFNQGFDTRLMTPKIADLLIDIPLRPVRFAYDDIETSEEIHNGITLMAERGHRDFRLYMLYNYQDTPDDFYNRMVDMQELADKLKVAIALFPMRYRPILTIDKNVNYTGKHWTLQQRKGIVTMLSRGTNTGFISSSSIEHLRSIWGEDVNKFKKTLTYPDLERLMKMRRANLRITRRARKQPVKQESKQDA